MTVSLPSDRLREEVGKPGTNWKAVTPENRKTVDPLVRHYMKQSHPHAACVRDNTKRFGRERAIRVCAVVKDMGRRGTDWREGAKRKVAESEARIQVVEGELGAEAVKALKEAESLPDQWLRDLQGMLLDDYATLFLLRGDPLEERTSYGKRAAQRRDVRRAQRTHKATPASQRGLTALNARRQKDPKQAANPDFEAQHPRGSGDQGGQFIRKGSSGAEVRSVQKAVGADTSGKFDDKTAKLVREYQKKHGLQVDGVVGRQTAAAIRGKKGAKKVKVGALSSGDRKRLRRGKVKEELEESVRSRRALENAAGRVRHRPLVLGGGVGVERQTDDQYVVSANGKAIARHKGPLSAASDGLARAGAMSAEGTPGGTRSIKSPEAAARLHELEGEIRELEEMGARRNRRAVPGLPHQEDTWAADRLRDLRAERNRLLRPAVQEGADPGPLAERTVGALLRRYNEALHPRDPGGHGGGQFIRKPGHSRRSRGRALPAAPSRRGGAEPHKLRYSPEGVAKGRVGTKKTISPEGIVKTEDVVEPDESPFERRVSPFPEGSLERRLFGSGKDSQARFSVVVPGRKGPYKNRVYAGRDPEGGNREQRHQRIIRGFRTTPDGANLLPRPAGRKPKAVNTSGGSASGKGRLERGKGGVVLEDGTRVEPELEHAVHSNTDDIRPFLPEYDELMQALHPRSAGLTHEEASDIGKRLVAESLADKQDLYVDGTGGGERGKFRGKLDEQVRNGYDVEVFHVHTPLEVARKQEKDRYEEALKRWKAAKTDQEKRAASRSLRRVAPEVLETSHRESAARFVELLEEGGAYDLRAYSRDGELIAFRLKGQKLEVRSTVLWAELKEKGKGA